MKQYADYDMVSWVLNESGKTISEISKDNGISWTAVSDLVKGMRPIEKTSFLNAIKLTEYGLQLQEDERVRKAEVEEFLAEKSSRESTV